MGQYKYVLNKRTGRHDLVPTNTVIAFKGGVLNVAALPAEGNKIGDGRITQENHRLYVWDGSEWQYQDDIVDLHWGVIEGRPTLPPVEIDEAAEKRHDRNKDQYLDQGGANSVFAGDIKPLKWNMARYIDGINGDDNNSGASESKPVKTISKLISLIPRNLNGYDCWIKFANGTYILDQSINLQGINGGKLYITPTTYPDPSITIQSAHDMFLISGISYFEIRDISCKLTADEKYIFRLLGSNIWTQRLKFGDNGNDNTYVFRAEVSQINIDDCSSIDENKCKYVIHNYGSIISSNVDLANLADEKFSTFEGSGLLYSGLPMMEINKEEYEATVEKKHEKDTDQFLDYGGANQKAASELPKRLTENAIYRVDGTDGNDDNDGIINPFKTIAKAVETINNLGDIYDASYTILVRTGTYDLGSTTLLLENLKGNGSIAFTKWGFVAPTITGTEDLIRIVNCNIKMSINNVQLRLNENFKNCIYIHRCLGLLDIYACSFGDTSNTGTVGIRNDYSKVYAHGCADLDSEKVATGIVTEWGGITIINSDDNYGDIFKNSSNEGINFQGNINFVQADYDDTIAKKHAQNTDTILKEYRELDLRVFEDSSSYETLIDNYKFAQVFTEGETGNLAKIALWMERRDESWEETYEPNLVFEIRSVSDGKPTEEILATYTMDAIEAFAINYGSKEKVEIIFASPASVVKDTQYAIVIYKVYPNNVGNYDFYIYDAGSDVYPDGTGFVKSGEDWDDILEDFEFETYVPINEPIIENGELKRDLIVSDGVKIDDRDLSVDGAKLDTIEEGAVSLNTVKTDETIRDVIYEAGYNEGMLSEPIITGNVDGTIQVSSIDVLIRSTADFSGGRLYKKVVPAITDLAVAEGLNYIYVDYATGNPVYKATAIRGLINNSNTILVARVMERSNVVQYKVNHNASALSLATKTFDKQLLIRGCEGIEKESGFGISETPTRVVNVGSGFLWFGLKRIELGAIAQGGGGVISDLWYHSTGVWTKSIITNYNNTQYDNGNDLAELTTNRYAVNWIFRNISTNEIDIVLGRGDYTLAQAVASTVPPLPDDVTYFYLLVGRIIVQKGSDTATSIETVELDKMSTTIVSEHNDLGGLDTGNYLHMTPTEKIPIYEQTEEPILPFNGQSAFWYDTDDNYRCYLIHRRGDKGSGLAEQVKVELI